MTLCLESSGWEGGRPFLGKHSAREFLLAPLGIRGEGPTLLSSLVSGFVFLELEVRAMGILCYNSIKFFYWKLSALSEYHRPVIHWKTPVQTEVSKKEAYLYHSIA